jgi:hypothetical protein
MDEAKAACETKTPKNFWRTLATARPSTGGPNTSAADREAMAKKHEEWKARQKQLGVVNGKSYGHWKDGRAGGRWVRVDPKTQQPLPDV